MKAKKKQVKKKRVTLKKTPRFLFPRPRAVEYIKKLDLQYIAKRLVDKQGWEPSEAQGAVRKYKNALILLCLHPECLFVPTKQIDEVWHDHILHTQEYMRDCKRIFGEYMHHMPSSGSEKESEHLNSQFKILARLYQEQFHEPYITLSPADLAQIAVARYEALLGF
jgi:hypothetical protein